MKSRATPRFWAAYRELPPEIREAARKAYRLFRGNVRHPSLQFKKVHDRDPVYAVRVTLGYRALGLLDDEEIRQVQPLVRRPSRARPSRNRGRGLMPSP